MIPLTLAKVAGAVGGAVPGCVGAVGLERVAEGLLGPLTDPTGRSSQ